MVAHGSVSAHHSALEGVALDLRRPMHGAAGHHEGKVWRRRRRALGWAQGVCRAGRTIGGSTFRRDGWEGPADGNEASAPKTAWHAKRYLGELQCR